MTEQMALDLRTDDGIAAEEERRAYFRSPAFAYDWLMEVHGCTEAVIPVCERLYGLFSPWDAFDRCKCLTLMDGKHRLDGWTLDDCGLLGLFEPIDYHTCWDRERAAKKGIAKEDIPRITRWDYGKGKPIYRETK